MPGLLGFSRRLEPRHLRAARLADALGVVVSYSAFSHLVHLGMPTCNRMLGITHREDASVTRLFEVLAVLGCALVGVSIHAVARRTGEPCTTSVDELPKYHERTRVLRGLDLVVAAAAWLVVEGLLFVGLHVVAARQ